MDTDLWENRPGRAEEARIFVLAFDLLDLVGGFGFNWVTGGFTWVTTSEMRAGSPGGYWFLTLTGFDPL